MLKPEGFQHPPFDILLVTPFDSGRLENSGFLKDGEEEQMEQHGCMEGGGIGSGKGW